MSRLGSITARQWNTLSAGTLSFFFDSWDAFLLIYVLTDIATEFRITVAKASLALLFTYLSRWLGGLVLGSVAARWGRKKALALGILIFGVFTVLTGYASSFEMLLFFRLCFGIGMGGVYAAAGPLVVESVGPRVRGFASGLFMFGFYLGNVLAPWTYYLMEPHFGWRGMFWFGGVSLLLIPYVLLTVPESPAWKARADVLRKGAAKGVRALPTWKLFAPAYIGITMALLLVEFGEFFDSYPFQSILPTYLKVERHFPIHMVALAGSAIGVGALIGSLCGGLLSDRIGRKRTFAIGFILAIVPTSVSLLTHQAWLVVVASFVNGMIFGSLAGIVTAFENEHFPTDLRAAGNGVLHNLGALGGSIGAVLAATLRHVAGYGTTIIIIASSGAVLGLLGLYFTRETHDLSLHELDETEDANEAPALGVASSAHAKHGSPPALNAD